MAPPAPGGVRGNERPAAWLAGLAVAVAAYAAWHALHLPALAYLPEVGRWTFAPPADAIAMHYYGWLLVGLVAFGLGYRLGRVPPVARRLATPAGSRWLGRVVVLELAAALAYLAVSELARWAG